MVSKYRSSATLSVAVWIAATLGFAEAPEPATRLVPDADTTVLLYNATGSSLRYSVWYVGNSNVARYSLAAGKPHLYRARKPFMCRFKSNSPTLFEHGGIYEFRQSATGEIALIQLQRDDMGQDGIDRPDEPADAVEPADANEVSELRQSLANLDQKNSELKTDNEHLRGRVILLQEQLEELRQPPEIKSDPISFGELHLEEGACSVELKLLLIHDRPKPLSMRIRPDIKLTAGEVLVEPRTLNITSQDPVDIRLSFRDVPAGRSLQGKLMLTGEGEDAAAWHAVSVNGVLTSAVSELPARDGTITILTWPPGAAVYVTDPAASQHRWARKYLGVTPVQGHRPDVNVQFLIVPPSSAQPASSGSWACWDGKNVRLNDGSDRLDALQIDVSKDSVRPVTVRALWLAQAPCPDIDGLQRLTEHSATLFTPPKYSEFFAFAVDAMARAGLVLCDDDVRKLYAVMHKSGYARVSVSADTAVDFDFCEWRNPPLAAKGVRIQR